MTYLRNNNRFVWAYVINEHQVLVRCAEQQKCKIRWLQLPLFLKWSSKPEYSPLCPWLDEGLERPSGPRIRAARWGAKLGAAEEPAVEGSYMEDSSPSGLRFRCPPEVWLQVLSPPGLLLLEINLELTLVNRLSMIDPLGAIKRSSFSIGYT
jgi:hypothetical protein